MPRKAHLIKKLLITLMGYYMRKPHRVSKSLKCEFIFQIWYYTKLTPFVARGPCASQGSLDQKTSAHVKSMCYFFNERNNHVG